MSCWPFQYQYLRLADLASLRYLQTGRDATLAVPANPDFTNFFIIIGDCKYNGEGCMTTEITLVNPSSAGSGSSVDLSLIPP